MGLMPQGIQAGAALRGLKVGCMGEISGLRTTIKLKNSESEDNTYQIPVRLQR